MRSVLLALRPLVLVAAFVATSDAKPKNRRDADMTEVVVAVFEEVLAALEAEDLDAYEALLHPEFVSIGHGPEGSLAELPRHRDLELTRKFFEDIDNPSYALEPGFRVEPGDEPATWAIREVATQLELDTEELGHLSVRQVGGTVIVARGVGGNLLLRSLDWGETASMD